MNVKLTITGQPDQLVAKAVDLLTSRWKERTRVPLRQDAEKPAWELVIQTREGLPAQGYTFTTRGRVVTLTGADGRGVLYGVGHLLRTLAFADARVPVPDLNVTRAPAVYNRGTYFATHFHNYYEAAAVEKVEHYIEEMALWGFDLWMFWFDMNWFPHGFWRDPNSRGMKLIQRLRRLAATARACGMKVVSVGVANEGFHNQPPVGMRADISGRHGGFYAGSQICPSKPGGMKMILENRRQVLELLGPLDCYIHWPYDQGGCGCAACSHAPGRWGKKFLEIGKPIAGVVRELNPHCEIIVSMWLMDEAERQMVYAKCDANADWFAGIIAQAEHIHEHPIPSRYVRLTFPEISMFDCYFCSYGCNGANPAPQRMATEASRVAKAGWGTELYSEGIYTDLNAAVYASRLWDPDRAVPEILTEYSRYYYGPGNVKLATELLAKLETTWGADALNKADAKLVARLLTQARSLKVRLPRHQAARERWRMLVDRAEMDHLMKTIGSGHSLVVESRALHESTAYMPTPELRRRVRAMVVALRRRKKLMDQLMAVHWRYLLYFDMEKNIMTFLPDDVTGRYNWETLIEPLTQAAAQHDETQLRRAVSHAFKRWYWSNSIDLRYAFD